MTPDECRGILVRADDGTVVSLYEVIQTLIAEAATTANPVQRSRLRLAGRLLMEQARMPTGGWIRGKEEHHVPTDTVR